MIRSPLVHRLAPLSIAGLLAATAVPATAQRSQSAADKTVARAAAKPASQLTIETNEDLQPTALPPLPVGMTTQMLVEGDKLFHGRGGCFACHGTEAQGLPAAGDGITSSLSYARHEWRSLDSLIRAGVPDAITRSPIAMPARGARGDLSDAEIQQLSAYIWAISGVKGEPWPGGHASHVNMVPAGSTQGTAPTKPVRVRTMVPTPAPVRKSPSDRSGKHENPRPS
jgi:mono/diheme cytochrome c family protein